MRKLSLFSGIGGIDLAAHWAGMETVAFCEREPFPQQVLQKNFPGVPIYDDVCTLNREVLERDGIIESDRAIDIISAGFPCQPFSHAGNREGTDDERHLWPEVVRVVKDIKPTWFVGENVTGLLSMAEPTGRTNVESRIINRTSDEDYYEAVFTQQEIMLISSICKDLENIDYEVQVYVLPAAAVGASHKRERVFILGYSEYAGSHGTEIGRGFDSAGNNDSERKKLSGEFTRTGQSGNNASMGYPSSEGLPKWRRSKQSEGEAEVGTGMVTESERSSEIMADSKSNSQRGLSIGERTANTRPACSSQHVANAKGGRQREAGKLRCEQSTQWITRRGTAPRTDRSRAAQCGMGGDGDELPNRLDRRGIATLDALAEFVHSYPQPAFMGQQQYDWEPPRVAIGIKNRAARLKALGNAVDPLQIYPVLAAIKFIHENLNS